MTTAADPLVGQVPEELEKLRALYAERKPKRVLEIGVWHGGTLRVWLSGNPDIVVAVDPAPYISDPDANYVLIVGRSQDEEIRNRIREFAPYDWVFIDGDHAYGSVKADTELALEVTRPGGLILLHDIEYDKNYGSIGPDQAFLELAVGRNHWKIIEDPEPSGYPAEYAHGIGIVER